VHPRVAFTPGSITGVVRAQTRHRCDSHLTPDRHHIEPGELYVANALPPGDTDIGNTRWWHLRLCLDCCPARFDPRLSTAQAG
jgi:hypothetical protein